MLEAYKSTSPRTQKKRRTLPHLPKKGTVEYSFFGLEWGRGDSKVCYFSIDL